MNLNKPKIESYSLLTIKSPLRKTLRFRNKEGLNLSRYAEHSHKFKENRKYKNNEPLF